MASTIATDYLGHHKPGIPRRFGIIGMGGIGRSILDLLRQQRPANLACAAVLVRADSAQKIRQELDGAIAVVTSLESLASLQLDVVVEAAGHTALIEYGETILDAGCDLLSVSAGALSDLAVEQTLSAAAARSGHKLLLPAGALVGLDGLLAARHGGLTTVTYRGCKPVRAWRGTAAEKAIDLNGLTEATTFFTGTAREAARCYPMNANVTATLALAGVGFDRTRVSLVADPAGQQNLHELHYAGVFGEARITVEGRPSSANPRTSALTAFSLWQTLLDHTRAAVCIG